MGNIIIEDMNNEYWDKTQDELQQERRLLYLKKFVKPLPTRCPECGHDLYSEEDETICEHCGLIVSASIEYVAGIRIMLPYGRR